MFTSEQILAGLRLKRFILGKNNKNCKWCPFKDSELCNKKERIKS